MVADKKLKIVFFGTPAAVVPFVNRIFEAEKLVGVVTQPPKVSGRGFKLEPPPVAVCAQGLQIDYMHPENLSDKKFISDLAMLKPDLCVVAAFGRKIPKECLEIPKNGFVNIHYSLLPKYRGPAPIQHALLNREAFTGVSIFFLNDRIDEGPLIAQKQEAIQPDDDYFSLEAKLTKAGEILLEQTLKELKGGSIVTSEQKGTPSKAPLIKKEDAKINWDSSAYKIAAQVKAYIKWPKSHFFLADKSSIKLLKASISPMDDLSAYKPGTITGAKPNAGIIVKCSDTGLLIERIIPEGRKEMPAWAFWQSGKLKIGDQIY